MSIYQSVVFNFELNFSEGWIVKNWGEWKNPPKNLERYQTSDKDFPSPQQKNKYVFHAVKRGPNLLSKQIIVDAIWSDKVLDINSETKEQENEVLRNITNEKILGKEDCQSIIRQFKNDENYFYQQSFLFYCLENIWLCITVAGDTKKDFDIAKEELMNISALK